MPHRIVHHPKLIILTCVFSVSAPLVQLAVPAGAIAHADSAALPERGDASALVVRLQELLQKAGVRVAGGADGMFGPATAKAVATFQTAKGLAATGVVDIATATALGLMKATPQLAPGSTGSAVRTLQQRLQAWGVKVKGGADGLYGPATATAVAQFQTSRKLPVTGNVDAYTAAVLAGQATTATGAAPSSGLPKPGTTGTTVKTVQQQLVAVGARPKGGVDGAYGPATTAAIALFQRWMGLPSSGVLDGSTATALATTAAKATGGSGKLASFPLPRTCAFGDTWGAPRSGGRRHVGTDIFARRGASVLAVADGRITRLTRDFPGSRGGNQFWLTAKNGTKYFYGHLDGFASGMGAGVPVRAGDVIGYAGKTGLTTVTHLHFEIHPGGGPAVNPYGILRRTAGC